MNMPKKDEARLVQEKSLCFMTDAIPVPQEGNFQMQFKHLLSNLLILGAVFE